MPSVPIVSSVRRTPASEWNASAMSTGMRSPSSSGSRSEPPMSALSSPEIMQFIGNGANYQMKYRY